MKDTAYYEEINRLAGTEKHYFAAANTSAGFVSFFDALFDPKQLKKIYILKGGPGRREKHTHEKRRACRPEKRFSSDFLPLLE